MFSPDEIKRAVAYNLATDITVPDGHKVALVTFINTNKAEVTLATRINNHWNVELIGSHEWTGKNDLGVLSKVTW